jgi:hypothetical protein
MAAIRHGRLARCLHVMPFVLDRLPQTEIRKFTQLTKLVFDAVPPKDWLAPEQWENIRELYLHDSGVVPLLPLATRLCVLHVYASAPTCAVTELWSLAASLTDLSLRDIEASDLFFIAQLHSLCKLTVDPLNILGAKERASLGALASLTYLELFIGTTRGNFPLDGVMDALLPHGSAVTQSLRSLTLGGYRAQARDYNLNRIVPTWKVRPRLPLVNRLKTTGTYVLEWDATDSGWSLAEDDRFQQNCTQVFANGTIAVFLATDTGLWQNIAPSWASRPASVLENPYETPGAVLCHWILPYSLSLTSITMNVRCGWQSLRDALDVALQCPALHTLRVYYCGTYRGLPRAAKCARLRVLSLLHIVTKHPETFNRPRTVLHMTRPLAHLESVIYCGDCLQLPEEFADRGVQSEAIVS